MLRVAKRAEDSVTPATLQFDFVFVEAMPRLVHAKNLHSNFGLAY